MDVLQPRMKVAKFFYLLLCWTQILLCCSSTPDDVKLDDVQFGGVSCNNSGLTVDISFKNFQGIIYFHGSSFNSNCSYAPLASGSENISLFLPLTDCGTAVRKLHGTIYISNLIVIQKHRFVETASDRVHAISCKLLHPQSQETEGVWSRGNLSSHYTNNVFESWMDFQLGSNSLDKDVSNTLMVGDEFIMAIHLKYGGTKKDIKVERCWAYEGETVEESEYVLQIYDKYRCESSEWVSDFNSTNERVGISDAITYAAIKAFKFPLTNKLRITCSVQVCSESCVDYCKLPKSENSNAYPRVSKRSTSESSPDRSLQKKFKLMKKTVKALGARLVEFNRVSESDVNSGFHRRISNLESTTGLEVIVVSEEYDFYSKEYDEISSNPQSKIYNADSENAHYMHVFNLTNEIVVFQNHDFNFKYISPTEISMNCVSKFRYRISMVAFTVSILLLLITCIGMALYVHKEKKKYKLNSYLLYTLF